MMKNKLYKLQVLIKFIPSTRLKSFITKNLNRFINHKRINILGLVNGYSMKLDLNESIQRQMYLGTYETEQTLWVKEILKSGDTFVDVGASFGYYTTLASNTSINIKVYAFEPSTIAFEKLSENIKNNKSISKNISLYNIGLGDNEREDTLYLPTTDYVHSPSLLKSDPTFKAVKIKICTLDNFFKTKVIGKIKLIKIDVEGYEPNVLIGMKQMIALGKVENIICELNSGWLEKNKYSNESLAKLLIDLGFKIHKKTALKKNLPSHDGGTYNYQDVWFKYSVVEN